MNRADLPCAAYTTDEAQASADQNITWMVTPQNFAIEVSNLFYFGIYPPGESPIASQYFLIAADNTTTTASTSSSSSSSSSSISLMTAPTSAYAGSGPTTPPLDESRSPTPYATAKLGLGLGIGLGVPAIAALIGILYLLMRRSRQEQPPRPQSVTETVHQSEPQPTWQSTWKPTRLNTPSSCYKASSDPMHIMPPAELAAEPSPAEMQAARSAKWT